MLDLSKIIINALQNSTLSDYRIAAETGISAPSIANYRKEKKKPSTGNLQILANYFGIYLNSLGEFEISRPHAHDEDKTTYVYLLPVSAQGGSLSNFAESVDLSQCERLVSPIKEVSFAMSVTGDSMEPEYPGGSKVLIKKINERSFIEWGRCYVLDTCNGSVIKKLMPSEDPDKLKCVSANPSYPPFEVCLADIYGVYRVLMMLSEK